MTGDDAALQRFDADPARAYRAVRGASEALLAPLSAEDAAGQSMEDASPAKWHLAHTTWFFETFVLEGQPGHEAFDPAYRVLFNSYYNAVGEQHPRPRRGLLTRPSLDEVCAYRRHVAERIPARLEDGLPSDELAVVELGLHHEQQHQELLLTDLKHLLSCNPLRPAYRETPRSEAGPAKSLAWHSWGGGERWIGHEGPGFCFDNESPRHKVWLEPFQLASRPVTNGEYQAFIEDGGYERAELWLADGWATVQEKGWSAPLYWEERDGEWWTLTLGGPAPVRSENPVTHVSLYEADAYATWACARLPSEQEWECAAWNVPIEGNFVETGRLHPGAAARTTDDHPAQLYGDVWEWTRSASGPYPRYQPPEGAIGEYNGKFMSNQLVLRGGSCATPGSHVRATYRNFFYPHQRWQFTGIRLARDL